MGHLMQSFLEGANADGARLDAPGSRLGGALFWRLQLTGWGFIGVGGFLLWMGVLGAENAAYAALARAASGIAFTCLLREIYRRVPWREVSPWLLLAGVFVLCIFAGVADTALAKHFVFSRIRADVPVEAKPVLERFGLLMRCGSFFGWSVLYFAIIFWQESVGSALRAARLEAAARTAELRQLQAQVNPHFLFNALNAILAEKDNAPAVERIAGELADYLRHALRAQEDFAPLGVELDLIERYLRVEKSRFEERLVYAIEADAAARAEPVPAALVQPLLENACKYGRRTGPRILHVHIAARLAGDSLVIEVTNTGRWLETPPADSHGIGLSNLRRRLELLSRGRARLEHSGARGHVTVTVTWPLSSVRPVPQEIAS